MLLTVTIPSGPLAGRRRIIAIGEPERIRADRLLAYSNNPTLEYREVAEHNGEQVGDLLEPLAARRTTRKTAKPPKIHKVTYIPGTRLYWENFERTPWGPFFRKYPTVAAWLAAHPGQAIGRCVNPPEKVCYFDDSPTRKKKSKHPHYNYSLMYNGRWTNQPPADVPIYDTLAEWRVSHGMEVE